MQTEQDKKESRESGADFKFRRRMLTRALTERATWTGHRKNMTDALVALDKKALTKKDKALIRSALLQHRNIADAYAEAGIHAQALLEIIDDAGTHYKKDTKSRGYAQMLAWTTGKKENTIDHDAIIFSYLLQTTCGVSREDAISNIVKIFKMHSFNSAVNILKRHQKKLKLSLPAIKK